MTKYVQLHNKCQETWTSVPQISAFNICAGLFVSFAKGKLLNGGWVSETLVSKCVDYLLFGFHDVWCLQNVM